LLTNLYRMTTSKLIILSSAIVIFAACRSTKNTPAVAVAPAVAATPASTVTAGPAVKSINGVYPPGNAELVAIQKKYADVTLAALQTGHQIYTVGKCINCHGAKNIYKRGEDQWKGIIDDMAQRAQLSDADKDAVYKYVLSIKATQTN